MNGNSCYDYHGKRILWVEDQNNLEQYGTLFPEDEMFNAQDIQTAVTIAKNHLYQFDTILLDINIESFGEASKEKDVEEELKKELFLIDGVLQDKVQFQREFGYYFYLYLLRKGFPANRIAVFTGNTSKTICSAEKIEAAVEALQALADDLNPKNQAKSLRDFRGKLIAQASQNILSRNFLAGENIRLLYDALVQNNEVLLRKHIIRILGIKDVSSSNSDLQNTAEAWTEKLHTISLRAPECFAKGVSEDILHLEQWLAAKRNESTYFILRNIILEGTRLRIKQLHQLSNDNAFCIELNRLKGSGKQSQYIPASYLISLLERVQVLYSAFDIGNTQAAQCLYLQTLQTLLLPFEAQFDLKVYNCSRTEFQKNFYYATDGRIFENVTTKVIHPLSQYACMVCKLARNWCAHDLIKDGISYTDVIFIVFMVLELYAPVEPYSCKKSLLEEHMNDWKKHAVYCMQEGFQSKDSHPAIHLEKEIQTFRGILNVLTQAYMDSTSSVYDTGTDFSKLDRLGRITNQQFHQHKWSLFTGRDYMDTLYGMFCCWLENFSDPLAPIAEKRIYAFNLNHYELLL